MAHQVGVVEFDAGAIRAVVVKGLAGQLTIQVVAQRVARRIAIFQVQNRGFERRDGVGPDDAGVVMAGLDRRTDQTRNADAVAAHFRVEHFAVRPRHRGVHCFGVFGAEIEDVPNLDPAPLATACLRNLSPFRRIVLFVRGGVAGRDVGEEFVQIGVVAAGQIVHAFEGGIVINLALPGGGQHDKLVRQIAADRAGIGDHRDGFQAHTLEGAHIGQHHAAIAPHRTGVIYVERIRVLHQEFAPAHHPEPGPHFVAEFPLNVVEIDRQIPIRLHRLAEDVDNHFLVGGTVQHLPLVPVGDAQHFLAVVVVAAAFLPQLRRLDRRHQHFLGASGVLLLPHDTLDIA